MVRALAGSAVKSLTISVCSSPLLNWKTIPALVRPKSSPTRMRFKTSAIGWTSSASSGCSNATRGARSSRTSIL